MNIYDQLFLAIQEGINLERLLICVGLDHHTFNRYMDDEMFTSEQVRNLKIEIKEWNQSLNK